MCLMITAMLVTVLPVADDDKTLTLHPTIIRMHKEAEKQRKKYSLSDYFISVSNLSCDCST